MCQLLWATRATAEGRGAPFSPSDKGETKRNTERAWCSSTGWKSAGLDKSRERGRGCVEGRCCSPAVGARMQFFSGPTRPLLRVQWGACHRALPRWAPWRRDWALTKGKSVRGRPLDDLALRFSDRQKNGSRIIGISMGDSQQSHLQGTTQAFLETNSSFRCPPSPECTTSYYIWSYYITQRLWLFFPNSPS